MLTTPAFGPADAPLALTIEYRVDGTEGAAVARLFSGDPADDLAKLPATDGQWVTREVAVARPKSSAACRLEFHTGSLPVGKTLWVKSIRASAGGPATVQAAPAATEAVAPGGGKVLYFASFDKLKPYREVSSGTKLENGAPVVGTVLEREGDGQLPAGWGPAWSWNRAAVQEFRAAVHKGSMALGFKTVSGKSSTMLFAPAVEFPAGAVRVRLEYAAGGGSVNKGLVRFRQTLPTFGEVYDAADVPTTGDAWGTADFALDTHGATGGVLEFHTSKLPLGETFWLKSVTVYQPAE